MELHDRLKAAREDADLTQAQVAEQTGIARRQYILSLIHILCPSVGLRPKSGFL